MSPTPAAAEVQEEKQEQQEEENEAEMEEQERVDALLQRKKLLQDLGVVDQIQQLLQGHAEGRGVVQDGCSLQQSEQAHHRQQQMKVRSNHRLLMSAAHF